MPCTALAKPWAAEHRHSSAAQCLATETHRIAVAKARRSRSAQRQCHAWDSNAAALRRTAQQWQSEAAQCMALARSCCAMHSTGKDGLRIAWPRSSNAEHRIGNALLCTAQPRMGIVTIRTGMARPCAAKQGQSTAWRSRGEAPRGRSGANQGIGTAQRSWSPLGQREEGRRQSLAAQRQERHHERTSP